MLSGAPRPHHFRAALQFLGSLFLDLERDVRLVHALLGLYRYSEVVYLQTAAKRRSEIPEAFLRLAALGDIASVPA